MIVLKRLTLLILALPYLFSFVLLTVLSPITWALTGKNRQKPMPTSATAR